MDVVTVLTLTPASQGQGYQPLEPLALNFNFQVAGGPGGRSTACSLLGLDRAQIQSWFC